MENFSELMRSQYGLASRKQLKSMVGLTDRQIDRRLTSGEWEAPRRGILRSAAMPVTWESELLAAVLASGGVASHRCAAALWNLGLWRNPPPEVTVPLSRSRRSGPERLHRTTQWDRIRATTIRSIPVTGIERTILDCAGVSGFRTTERLAESAIRQGLTTWGELAQCLRVHSIQGRNGCLTLRRLLEVRLNDKTIPLSDFSRLVSNLLTDAGLPAPLLEYRIVEEQSGDLILQADLAWPKLKKAWELDGLEWHFGRREVERDRRKRNRAKAEGWTIQEILWSMYVDDPAALVAMARKFLCA